MSNAEIFDIVLGVIFVSIIVIFCIGAVFWNLFDKRDKE